MKNNEFQELVDQNLSELVWDERKRQRVLHAISEEEKPMKKISTTFILVAAILCLTVSALAAGIIFSKKVDNAKLADDDLLSKYGITSEMLTFFACTDEEGDGYSIVRYDGISPFSYVLGTYTVQIKEGTADASWNRVGSETSGGFEADAWGAEQLSEMLRVNRETNDVSQFAQKAREIAAKNDFTLPTETASLQSDVEMQRNAEKAKSAAKLSISEMEKIAREALSVRYAFTPEQSERLRIEEDNGWYLLFGADELPCYEFYFALGYDEDGYQGTGAGIYTVKINVENGTVEDILYDSALAGNG